MMEAVSLEIVLNKYKSDLEKKLEQADLNNKVDNFFDSLETQEKFEQLDLEEIKNLLIKADYELEFIEKVLMNIKYVKLNKTLNDVYRKLFREKLNKLNNLKKENINKEEIILLLEKVNKLIEIIKNPSLYIKDIDFLFQIFDDLALDIEFIIKLVKQIDNHNHEVAIRKKREEEKKKNPVKNDELDKIEPEKLRSNEPIIGVVVKENKVSNELEEETIELDETNSIEELTKQEVKQVIKNIPIVENITDNSGLNLNDFFKNNSSVFTAFEKELLRNEYVLNQKDIDEKLNYIYSSSEFNFIKNDLKNFKELLVVLLVFSSIDIIKEIVQMYRENEFNLKKMLPIFFISSKCNYEFSKLEDEFYQTLSGSFESFKEIISLFSSNINVNDLITKYSNVCMIDSKQIKQTETWTHTDLLATPLDIPFLESSSRRNLRRRALTRSI